MQLSSEDSLQKTMDGNLCCPSSTFQVQSFSLSSYERIVARKGLGRNPNTSYSTKQKTVNYGVIQTLSGRKCSDLDLSLLSQTFENYRIAVNMILEEVFADSAYAQDLGQRLFESSSQGYLILREEPRFNWKKDNKFGILVFERMHRNVLETAARIIHSHHTKKLLVNALLTILSRDIEQTIRLTVNRRVPSDIIRKVRDVDATKSKSFHYALSSCRQVRLLLRRELQNFFSEDKNEMKIHPREILKNMSPYRERAVFFIQSLVNTWLQDGFPFTIPIFQRDTMDFSASTENSTCQGYWFMPDKDREDEIILYIKTPPGIVGHDIADSPYKSQTIRLRFLNWLPRKAKAARVKAEVARSKGDVQRVVELEYRAERFEDMNIQLSNTIKLQHLRRELAKQRSQENKDDDKIRELKKQGKELKRARSTSPPIIQLKGKKATFIIPFMTPSEQILESTLRTYTRTKKAGADRGLRYSLVVSVENGVNEYKELMIEKQTLLQKRERLRQRTKILMSQIARKRNNWEIKQPGLQPPAFILKKERELESVWRKIRRLDKEISHQVASETIWFCEHLGVKTIYFEDLRNFQGKGGMRTHSWNLSTNLWGQMIQGITYRRIAMGYRHGGVWMVNPFMTSQMCSVCGEKGIRVQNKDSEEEQKGGEFFYCPICETRLQADVNAARNIMSIQISKPSAAPGRTV